MTDHVTLLLPFWLCCGLLLCCDVALDRYVKLGFILYYTFSYKRKNRVLLFPGGARPHPVSVTDPNTMRDAILTCARKPT